MEQRLEGGSGSREAGWRIPDEVPAGFDETSEAFFESAPEDFEFPPVSEPTPEDREVIEKRTKQLFLPSCAPKWLRGGAAMIATLSALASGGAGFGRLLEESRERGAAVQAEAVVQKAKQEQQRQLESEPVKRLSQAFDRGAEGVRTSKALESRLTSDQRETIARAIDTFPLEDTLKILSEKTGDSIPVLAQSNRVEFVSVYSAESVSGLMETYQGELTAEETESITMLMHGGGVNVDGRAIHLNISEIIEQVPADNPEALGEVVQDVLMHEFMHGFPKDAFLGDGGDARLVFYEGMTEWLANDLMDDIRGDQANDPFSGYTDGGTSTAAFFVAAIDNTNLVYDAYTSGQFDRLDTAFQEASEGMSLDSVLTVDADAPFADSDRYQGIAALQGMVKVLGDDAWEVAAKANTTLDTGHITLYQDADYQGISLTSDQAQTGFANGVLWNPDRTILLSSAMPNGVTKAAIKTKDNYGMVFADINGSGESQRSLDRMSQEDRTEYVQKVLSAVSGELDKNAS